MESGPMIDLAPIKIPLRHRACGEVCYYYSVEVVAGDVVEAKYATTVDGRQCEPGEIAECPTCQCQIPVWDLTR